VKAKAVSLRIFWIKDIKKNTRKREEISAENFYFGTDFMQKNLTLSSTR